ncbi:MAG: glycoside hydrolase family 16 protein [Flavobacterium sp.]|uniref:glycoside hydrolase family 16 protein n=1 Tax=Flavobacterium sp. TaxID=239 RepID=UPI00262E8165|nr:glycoside hydrolase family 16 protein [Flavobacterium sp.]MDD5150478.1 glycoside hydrolase family 16 protein [Flavobacterium sp.]
MTQHNLIFKYKLVKLFSFSLFLLFLFSTFALASCSGDSGGTGGGGGGTGTGTTPSGLVVSAAVFGTNAQNPNGDGSGLVTFTINANNATSYKIDLGNGDVQTVSSGLYSYTYQTSGTNSFKVYVSAYNGANFVSTSVTFTLYVAPISIWSDEFDTNGTPDSSKWGYDLGAGGWGNNESQYYTNRPENVIVSNGTLKINTIKESYSGSNYTSTRLLSKGKFSFKYGKVEFRAKFPTGGGTWPAVWMLGSNIDSVGWPACGEIDMLEEVGNQLNVNHSSLHSPGRSGNTPDTATVTVANGNTDFHIYTMDWRADFIKFYVDNQLYYSFINSSSLPFNQNFFLIINCAIGGNFGGTIDPNFVSSTFEIDYVRVYN